MIQYFKPQLKEVSWNWVTVEGPDASDFLHRLSTTHVHQLPVGQGKRSFFLDAQGKIKVFFTLWRLSQQSFALEFHGGKENHLLGTLQEWMDQYRFSEKMTLTPQSLEWVWVFYESHSSFPSLQPFHTLESANQLRVFHQGSQTYGRNWLSLWGSPEALQSWIKQYSPQRVSNIQLEKWRIEAFQPQVEAEIHSSATPLELGLQEAIEEQKGCYPGQEVIEKMISIGSSPRRLAQIQGQGVLPQPGDLIFRQEDLHEIGRVTSSISLQDSNFLALGVMKKRHAQKNLQVRFSNSLSTGKIQQVV